MIRIAIEIALLCVGIIISIISFKVVFGLVRVSQVLLIASLVILASNRAVCMRNGGDVAECVKAFDSTFIDTGKALYSTATQRFAPPQATKEKEREEWVLGFDAPRH